MMPCCRSPFISLCHSSLLAKGDHLEPICAKVGLGAWGLCRSSHWKAHWEEQRLDNNLVPSRVAESTCFPACLELQGLFGGAYT